MRRPPRRPGVLLAVLGLGLALPVALTTPDPAQARTRTEAAPAPPTPRLTSSADALTLTVPPSGTTPGYTLRVTVDQLSLTTSRSGGTVLATADGNTGGALRFHAADAWQHATRVTDWAWKDGTLALTAATTLTGATVRARITPSADRYRLDWQVGGVTPERLGLAYDLDSAGHWYGHGEAQTPKGGPATDQPWPLDTGQVVHEAFGPASYYMIDPFWYTSSATGLRVDTGHVMNVAINQGEDGLGRFDVESADPYRATVFVESTPLEVYRDYVGIVGRPAKTDATYRQYAEPVWNSWAQFYTHVGQAGLLDYAQDLHDHGLTGHTLQLDDKWESNYGNLTFDPKAYPDPGAMSRRIHDLGFDFGLWVTLWINLDSDQYAYAADHGYLLADATDPGRPCRVTWWNGVAGIVDLADPDAAAWYKARLRALMTTYGIEGLKFDTRFFDERCAPRAGYAPTDYQRLGAELADEFDLQGVGIRVHWDATAHRAGFVTRQLDKGTGWNSLRASVTQNLAISTIGYPFVTTDMIGGSSAQPAPTKEVLIRWAQSASLMPLMYASTSPVSTIDVTTGRKVVYDEQTTALYRQAVARHARLAPYIWDQVQHTLKTGDPIMRPLFFDFPHDQQAYTITDEWMLGPAVLAAPQLTNAATRPVHLPPGTWYDVTRAQTLQGPRTIRSYATPLGVTPVFVKLGARGADKALRALR
ncbi:glycoside hydrolase family 31 protein [Streptomyces kebangsaanensis]|uniref:glycoside hydrolase family 31 protein n=1 Tax=Streptomyces kebangsaanensis TaxID=864058 RepID=UPI000AEF4897|nr:glycoside hydrolase family 31 protein [Streptomyces kebangsaanensis]